MRAPLAWSDLQYFMAVVERGSVGGAAQALQVNHSTVLRRIGQLERTLSVRLFDRLPRGYALTAHGHELAESVAGIPARVDAAQRRVTGADLSLAGTIRVTAPDTLVHALLLPLLAEFGHRHPQVRLEVAASNSFLNLTQREADVAVRGSNHPPEHLVGRRAGTLRTTLYAAPAYLASRGAASTDAPHRWVGHDAALAHLQSARWVRRHVPPDCVALRVDSLVAMADAVAAGIGVGWVLEPLADARGLEPLQPPPPAFDTQVWVLTHPDLRRVARIQALTGFLQERLSADPRLAATRP